MKRFLLILIAVAGPLAGCQGGDNPEQNLVNPTVSAPPDPTAQPPTQKNVQFGGARGGQGSFGSGGTGQ